MQLLFDKQEETDVVGYTLIPRPYQHEALDGTFRLFAVGQPGVLLRIFTGGGKTITTAMIADRWLSQGEDYRVMVVSYEKQLVWQFAEEIQDVLGVEPGIEMESEHVKPGKIPKVIVASRQSLAQHNLIGADQRAFMNEHGYSDDRIALCTFKMAQRLIRGIRRGVGPELIEQELHDWRQDYRCDQERGVVSRLHKFDWRLNWLVAFDEAHKHVQQLSTVGHLVEWFERNPKSKRLGMTATPKRADGISIGSKMFPAIAIDYPLKVADGACAVRDGFAVPYMQKYIQVERIDFADIKKLCGDVQSKWDQEVAKRLETELAGVCEPLLDLVENRKTLVFSPSVSMAQGVAEYVNARSKCRCSCGATQWHARSRVGDGAACKACNRQLTDTDVLKTPEFQAMCVWGEVPAQDRKEVYQAHQSGQFQFLSVCGLCREGYNDCLDDETEILGPNGWKRWHEVGVGDLIYSLSRTTGLIEIVPISCYIRRPLRPDERMVLCSGQHMSVRVTEGHNIHGKEYDSRKSPRHSKDFTTLKARDLIDRKREFAFPLAAEGEFSGVPLTDDELRFAAWFMTEGSWGKTDLIISQSTANQGLCDRIEAVLRSCGFDYRRRQHAQSKNAYGTCPMIEFAVPSGTHGGSMARNGWVRLAPWLDKNVSPLLHQMTREQFRLFWFELLLGDGSVMPGKSGWLLCSLKAQADAFTHMAAVRGFATSCAEVVTRAGVTVYRASVRDSQWLTVRPSDPRATRIGFTERRSNEHVWCVSNRNSTLVTRRQGKVMILGNCDISCVAIFRPVSRKASSLAEQMKGRGSRPTRGLIEGMATADERLAAIAASDKPNCLVVDLTGVTGLGDCATTVQIYAEGLEDVVIHRAEEIVLGGVEDVQLAIQRAKDEIEQQRKSARIAKEKREQAAQEEAKRRAQAGAKVDYTVHDVGSSGLPGMASDSQLKFIESLGIRLIGWEPTKNQAGRIIN